MARKVERSRTRLMLVALVGLAAAAPCGACKRGLAPTDGRAEPQQTAPRGERIEREVRARLYADPDLAGGGSIVVVVDGSHVVLEGWVASVNERRVAEADAAIVAGVAFVDDRLLVRPKRATPQSRGDEPRILNLEVR